MIARWIRKKNVSLKREAKVVIRMQFQNNASGSYCMLEFNSNNAISLM